MLLQPGHHCTRQLEAPGLTVRARVRGWLPNRDRLLDILSELGVRGWAGLVCGHILEDRTSHRQTGGGQPGADGGRAVPVAESTDTSQPVTAWGLGNLVRTSVRRTAYGHGCLTCWCWTPFDCFTSDAHHGLTDPHHRGEGSRQLPL